MLFLFCTLPVLLPILALLAGAKSLHAALIGILAALFVAVATTPEMLVDMGFAMLAWSPVMLEVVLIIAGGLLLSEALQASGAQTELADWLSTAGRADLRSVLLVVHGVTPFAESVTGFGIGITIGVPLLLRLGLPPARAAMIGLLGLCAVPWGSMAPGTLIAATMADLPFHQIGLASALISLAPFAVTGAIAAYMVQPGVAAVLAGLASGLTLTMAVAGANFIFGTAPAGAVGAVTVIALHLIAARRRTGDLRPVGRRGLAAYAVLLGGVLLAGAATHIMTSGGPLRHLASPALWLFVAAFWFSRGAPTKSVSKAALRAWLGIAPVAGAFLLLGVLMTVSGMAAALAQGLSAVGGAYLLLSPIVAATAGFITGSNSGANAMLAATQAGIGRELGVDLLWFMAIHNVAASFLLMASPGKIEMAAQLAQALPARRRIQRFALMVASVVVAILMSLSGLLALG